MELLAGMTDANEYVELPEPAIIAPVRLWTGKQIFSTLLKSCFEDKIHVNLRLKEKAYKGRSNGEPWMDMDDAYIVFHNSELLCGCIGKATLGGNKKGLCYFLVRNFSPEEAARRILRISKLTTRFLMVHGFSIGITDVTPSELLTNNKQELVKEGYESCLNHITTYENNNLEASPGSSVIQTLESKVNRDLSGIREEAAQHCLRELHWTNAPLICALSGSKGSNLNISQMVACVGQQTVNGSRPADGFQNRSLPHFKHYSRDPDARGFVAASFRSGLNPTEFYFHAMAGREGLVDTAVKTADTGYMQRRLVKALEDIVVNYDFSVRTVSKSIVQFQFGDDGLDPLEMEDPEQAIPISFPHVWQHIRGNYVRRVGCRDSSLVLLPNEIYETAESIMSQPINIGAGFLTETTPRERKVLLDFLSSVVSEQKEERISLGLSDSCKEDSDLERTWARISGVTRAEIEELCLVCRKRFERAQCQPGTTTGCIAGQSLGEPATQMTLNTFHFTGVASMSLNQGVPRLREIINATKNIATPVITANLQDKKSSLAARLVAARCEATTISQIAKNISLRHLGRQQENGHVLIELDADLIASLGLSITAEDVMNSIQINKINSQELSGQGAKMKIERHQMSSSGQPGQPQFIKIRASSQSRREFSINLRRIMSGVGDVVISGISAVKRALVVQDSSGDHTLLMETSTNPEVFRDVLVQGGIDCYTTKTNDIMATLAVLGVESARQTIVNELQSILDGHGLAVDTRHLHLLADTMTRNGLVEGCTRQGIGSMRIAESGKAMKVIEIGGSEELVFPMPVLGLASFERTAEKLANGAYAGSTDLLEGSGTARLVGTDSFNGTEVVGVRSLFGRRKYHEAREWRDFRPLEKPTILSGWDSSVSQVDDMDLSFFDVTAETSKKYEHMASNMKRRNNRFRKRNFHSRR